MRTFKVVFTICLILLLVSFGAIGFLFLDRQKQNAEFLTLQNQYTETKLELDRLKQVLAQSEEEDTINVYFPKSPDSDEDPTIVFPIVRELEGTDKVAAIINEYVVGLTADETEEGYYLPSGDYKVGSNQKLDLRGESTCGDRYFTSSVTAKVATIKFCKTLYGLGSFADAQVKIAMEKSLVELSEVDKAIFLTPEGDCLFDESGMNLCLE